MNHRPLPIVLCILALGWKAALADGAPTTAPAARPNLMLIVADDLCWRDLGFTGNTEVHTPNLDRLRSEGVYLRRMYSPASTCTPTRSALYTGLFNVRSGAYPNHSHVNPGTRSLFTYLKGAGYRVALQNKGDVRPPASFPYEEIEGQEDFKPTRAFITRKADEPWLLVFGSHDPHSPWVRGPKDLYDPAKLTVPSYLHDNPATRHGIAAYYAEVTNLDDQVGKLMELLRDTGHVNDTLVMFVSEQGSSFPYGGKWTCYENGIKTASVVRWPGKVKPGTTSDPMMEYIDVTPTFLAAAGVDPTTIDTGCPDATGNKGFDGRNFLSVLTGGATTFRDVIFAQHTAEGVIGTIGPCPLRTADDGHYQYIRCFTPDKTYSVAALHRSPIFLSWVKDAANDPALAKRLDMLSHPPAEELYDLQADPEERTNLAGDPKLASIKAGLAKQLDGWMAQQGDHGLATELAFKPHMTKGGGGD